MAPILAQSSLLSPHVGLLFWTLVIFGLLLLILRRFAWGPMVGALDEREKTIEESINRAEAALAEARRMQADNEAARREAERQAQAILRAASEEADRRRAEEFEKAKAEAAKFREQARAEIEREKQQALTELRTEVADLAIGAAEKILSENLDDDRQRKLVDRFITDLPQN
ncbi:MAG TPA: F0F1 ATP synthase subunit B [Rubricoccaceae bacterium]|nr:F0F1 ATP synthase subunit B [Rubricoccaceae bacterium]